MPGEGLAVREVDLVALPLRARTQSRPGDPPRPEHHDAPAPGFELAETRYEETFTLLRFVAPAPVPVSPEGLVSAHLDFTRRAAVFVER